MTISSLVDVSELDFFRYRVPMHPFIVIAHSLVDYKKMLLDGIVTADWVWAELATFRTAWWKFQNEDEDLDVVVVEDQNVQDQNQAMEQDLDDQNLADEVQKAQAE